MITKERLDWLRQRCDNANLPGNYILVDRYLESLGDALTDITPPAAQEDAR